MADETCFGFYVGNETCKRCGLEKKCKALLVSNGFDIMADVLDSLMGKFGEAVTFKETERLPELVDYLLSEQKLLTKEEFELLASLGDTPKTGFAELAMKIDQKIAESMLIPSVLMRKPGPTNLVAKDEDLDLE